MKKKMITLTIVMVMVASTLVACGGGAKYNDGTYEGEATGMQPLKVSVEVKDGKIADVKVTEHDETPEISDPAIEQIPAAIVEKNSTDVDAVSGATITSTAIKDAVNNALESAK
ncbi:FMN-binding protein [Paratissierella segnis]|jgi:fumarate reductase flavoprotein subunit|uniref:FMN-binding protein n=1 Tax=Paratissierella segnis TaxID=2763679 RepID=A0A926IJW9_9FIRM|nr:FMN-binding protein [Paratissierella segnis]MBC8587896.1 FMN-binding protein [Paratissierella segnis]